VSATTASATASILRPGDRDDLRAICGDRATFDAPLAPFTSWKIGGPADAMLVVENEDELAAVMRFCLRRKMPWWISQMPPIVRKLVA